ncbi:hypothetical protein JZ751_003701 [Albula glossodonta]|uniref:Uncharacterized protein n=1 Tax=Albula glossodonta TaxID=121402 RepID=A0A8T2MUA1_9TELE|nr:hypothetical protein JZ751_003701 [Albula glossodonta]
MDWLIFQSPCSQYQVSMTTVPTFEKIQTPSSDRALCLGTRLQISSSGTGRLWRGGNKQGQPRVAPQRGRSPQSVKKHMVQRQGVARLQSGEIFRHTCPVLSATSFAFHGLEWDPFSDRDVCEILQRDGVGGAGGGVTAKLSNHTAFIQLICAVTLQWST